MALAMAATTAPASRLILPFDDVYPLEPGVAGSDISRLQQRYEADPVRLIINKRQMWSLEW